MVALMKSDNHIAQPQKSNEWYTPARYIEAAREVMGGIDLDPASCALANETVKASRYYSKEDDGLSKEWYAYSVWLNPPYGDGSKYLKDKRTPGMMRAWIGKLIHEHKAGNVEQAILCCTLENGARWFNWLWDYIICLPDHKVMFDGLLPNESRWSGKYSHFHGSIFVYLGPNEQKFIDIFSEFGTIAKRVSPPKSAPSTLWGVQR